MLAGKVDISTTSDFVAVGGILKQSPVPIISSLCQPDMIRLVARKDHGIRQLSDLRNKSVGVFNGTVGEFFLDLLLVVQNISSTKSGRLSCHLLTRSKPF